MRTRISLALVVIVAAGVAAAQQAQIANPLPAPVVKRGLSVEIRTWSGFRRRAVCARPTRT